MRSISRGSKKDPDKYDDPLEMKEVSSGGTTLPPTAGVVLTGLNEEEDAARYVAIEFNTDLKFCPNCEGIYDRETLPSKEFMWCPYCGDNLRPVGTAPRRRKFDQR